jgi:hypothetical protein
MLKQCTAALSMLEEREEKVIMKEEAFRKDRENFISRETKKRRALEHTIVSRLDSVEGVYHMEGRDISIYRNEIALICVEKEKRWRQESDQKLQQCTNALAMLKEREGKVTMKEEAFRKDRENFISRETKKRRALEHTIVSRLDSVEGVYHMEGRDISIYRNENALMCVEKEKRWRQETDQRLQSHKKMRHEEKAEWRSALFQALKEKGDLVSVVIGGGGELVLILPILCC